MNTINKLWYQIIHQSPKAEKKKKEPGEKIQRKIKRLSTSSTRSMPAKSFSPTLSQLSLDKDKVKKMKSVYEKNIRNFGENCARKRLEEIIADESEQSPEAEDANVLDRIKSHWSKQEREDVVMEKETISLTAYRTFDPFEESLPIQDNKQITEEDEEDDNEILQIPKSVTRPAKETVKIALNFFIRSDDDYIKRMERLIDTYIREFENLPQFLEDNGNRYLPKAKRNFFGPIEYIHRFHLEEFHPMLLENVEDVGKMSKKLSKMFVRQRFDYYLIFAKDEEKCQKDRETFKSFMDKVSEKYNIPFVFNPIQQLTKYNLILKNIQHHLENEGKEEKLLSKAQNDMEKLLEKVYDLRYGPNHQNNPSRYSITI